MGAAARCVEALDACKDHDESHLVLSYPAGVHWFVLVCTVFGKFLRRLRYGVARLVCSGARFGVLRWVSCHAGAVPFSVLMYGVWCYQVLEIVTGYCDAVLSQVSICASLCPPCAESGTDSTFCTALGLRRTLEPRRSTPLAAHAHTTRCPVLIVVYFPTRGVRRFYVDQRAVPGPLRYCLRPYCARRGTDNVGRCYQESIGGLIPFLEQRETEIEQLFPTSWGVVRHLNRMVLQEARGPLKERLVRNEAPLP